MVLIYLSSSERKFETRKLILTFSIFFFNATFKSQKHFETESWLKEIFMTTDNVLTLIYTTSIVYFHSFLVLNFTRFLIDTIIIIMVENRRKMGCKIGQGSKRKVGEEGKFNLKKWKI